MVGKGLKSGNTNSANLGVAVILTSKNSIIDTHDFCLELVLQQELNVTLYLDPHKNNVPVEQVLYACMCTPSATVCLSITTVLGSHLMTSVNSLTELMFPSAQAQSNCVSIFMS